MKKHCIVKEISLDGRKFEFCGEIRRNFRVVKEEIANGKLPENVSYPYCCHFSKQSKKNDKKAAEKLQINLKKYCCICLLSQFSMSVVSSE